MKSLTRKDVGIVTKQTEPIASNKEETMWEKGVLRDEDPKALTLTTLTLMFLFKKFSLLPQNRSDEEHRSLTFETAECN